MLTLFLESLYFIIISNCERLNAKYASVIENNYNIVLESEWN